MATLVELKKKYDIETARYDPKPDCKHCKGTGERWVKEHNKHHPCICLFVAHKWSDEAGSVLGKFARKMLKEMNGGS